MTPDQRRERRAQLRGEDPHGRRSDNEIDRQVEIEDLHDRIYSLPSETTEDEAIRSILSDIVGLLG